MMKSTIDERVERLQVILDEINMLEDRAMLLIALIVKEDREEKDQVRYGGVLGS